MSKKFNVKLASSMLILAVLVTSLVTMVGIDSVQAWVWSESLTIVDGPVSNGYPGPQGEYSWKISIDTSELIDDGIVVDFEIKFGFVPMYNTRVDDLNGYTDTDTYDWPAWNVITMHHANSGGDQEEAHFDFVCPY